MIAIEARQIMEQYHPQSRRQLHILTYKAFRTKFPIASQLIIEATSYAWSRRNSEQRTDNVAVRFDLRLHSFRRTWKGRPILALRSNYKRIFLPLAKDGLYSRLLEHLNRGWRVSSIVMKNNLRLLAVLARDEPTPIQGSNVLGLDVNAARIAITITNRSGKVLRQLYLGRDLQRRQIHFEERRAKLQHVRDSMASGKAGLKLKRLAKKQGNYTHTRIWQVSKQILDLARSYDADIAIEKLRNLRKRKHWWRKRQRKKTNRIPYALIGHALRHHAAMGGHSLLEVDPAFTSQTCPQCGNIARRNRANWAYFRCIVCGFEANSDRVASLNICHRAARLNFVFARTSINRSQIPVTEALVSGLVLQDEESETLRGISPSCKSTVLCGQLTPSAPTRLGSIVAPSSMGAK
jgi:IS605 OrfB family transposase